MSNKQIEIPIDEEHPVLQLQYTYNHPFASIASAFIRKFDWEPRLQLTSITGVQQLDADRFQFYRRIDTVFSDNHSYERVTVNRADKTLTSEVLSPRPGNNERLYERGVLQGEDDKVIHNHYVFDPQGIRTWKVDLFKQNVENVLRAMKFAKWDEETA